MIFINLNKEHRKDSDFFKTFLECFILWDGNYFIVDNQEMSLSMRYAKEG